MNVLTVTSDYLNAIRSINRSFTFSVVINGVTLDGSKFKSIKITETGISSKKLTPGEFPKNSCELVATSNNGQDWHDRSFEVYMTVSGYDLPIPLGKFWTNTIKDQDSGYSYKITAYSRDPWWDEAYEADNGLTVVSDILDYFETKSGTQISGRNLITLQEITAVPQNITNAQMLGYIAGYGGYSVRMNRSGAPEIYCYLETTYRLLVPSTSLVPSASLYPGSTGAGSILVRYRIPTSMIFESGLSIEKETTIGSYAVTNEQTTLTVGSGYGVTYTNPYVTDVSEVESMSLYMDETYAPMTVKWRGDPALQIGDIVEVEGKNCYIMEQVFEIDGGFKSTIKCYSGEAQQMVLGQTTLDRKIRNVYAGMLKEIQEVFAGIFSAGNGYFSFIDSNREPLTVEDILDGAVPAGFRISDEPVVTATTKGWEFVLGGLYSSDDGFRTPGTLALTQDGYIVGSRVLAGSIEAESLVVAVQDILRGNRMNFSFEEDGLHIVRKDEEGNISESAQYQALYTDMGFRVMEIATGFASLIAEGDTVTANNLTADQYLRVRSGDENSGYTSSRFQRFYSTAHGEWNFGLFWEV